MWFVNNNAGDDNAASSAATVSALTKHCTGCGEVKALEQFNRYKKSPDGLNCRCKDCHNEYFRAYRAANRARINEIGTAYDRRAKTENPEMIERKRRRRRERERAAGTLTKDQKRAIWDAYEGRCYICHEDAEQYDHVQPLAAGGLTTADNMRPICSPCNARKGDDWPIDFDELRARIYRERRLEAERAEAKGA